jgi:hypothetical protein
MRGFGIARRAIHAWPLQSLVQHLRFEHPGMKYERVFFTLRPNGMFFHKNELPGIRKDGLNLDIVFFW